jgi:hypothetical protein
MEKEFIPYEQALQLKELGFNEPCITSYNESGKLFKIWEDEQVIGITKCLVPTFSQAFRWFREKYSLCIVIKPIDDKKLELGYNLLKNGLIFGSYLTYEKAELGCLKKLIDIVTKQLPINTGQ